MQCKSNSKSTTVLLVGAEGRIDQRNNKQVMTEISPNDLDYLRTTAILLKDNGTPLSNDFDIVVINPLMGGSKFESSKVKGDVGIFCYINDSKNRVWDLDSRKKLAFGYNNAALRSGASHLATIVGDPFEDAEIGPQDFPSFSHISSAVVCSKDDGYEPVQACFLLESKKLGCDLSR